MTTENTKPSLTIVAPAEPVQAASRELVCDHDPNHRSITTIAKAGDICGLCNIGHLHLIAPESDVCPRCFGTGMEVVPGEGARRCECQTADFLNRLMTTAKIPGRYAHCTLHNFLNAEQEVTKFAALSKADKFISEFPEFQQNGTGLLFAGPVGVGKTHLAVAMLVQLIQRYKIHGLFYQFGALLKEIQNSFNATTQTSEWSILQPVLDVDVLVLDELGASKPTEWVRDMMTHVINTRYNEKRITIFTTNYRDERMPGSPETLEERIGPRLRSRLYEMTRLIVIAGRDFRQTFDEKPETQS
jgi:DNA replication protein DnaC